MKVTVYLFINFTSIFYSSNKALDSGIIKPSKSFNLEAVFKVYLKN